MMISTYYTHLVDVHLKRTAEINDPYIGRDLVLVFENSHIVLKDAKPSNISELIATLQILTDQHWTRDPDGKWNNV